jgi:large repetitive protein
MVGQSQFGNLHGGRVNNYGTMNLNGINFILYSDALYNNGTINNIAAIPGGTIYNECGGSTTGNPGSGTQVVTKCDPTTTTLQSSSNPTTFGNPTSLTAIVSPSTTIGTVTFTIDGTSGTPVAISSGKVILSTSKLSV